MAEWPLPLVSVRNCYLAPLEAGEGCDHLGTSRGSDFGLNKYGQETTGKRACLAMMHNLGGDSFNFAVGFCQIWRCGSRAALRASAGPVEAEPESPDPTGGGAKHVAIKTSHGGYLTVHESSGLVAAHSASIGSSSRFWLSSNDDGSHSLATHSGHYVTFSLDERLRVVGSARSFSEIFRLVHNEDGTISIWSPVGRAVSAQPDGSLYANRVAVDGWEKFELVELASPSPGQRPAVAPAAPEGASVFSSLCEFQEATGGVRGREKRSPVFAKLWEWNYPDIARECREYLGPNGFDAVQISPVTEHVLGYQWWTKYQPVSFGLNTRSGTAEEFYAMVAACRAAGVEVIVDVIVNHMASPCPAAKKPHAEAAWATPCGGWNGSRYGNRRMAGARGWDAATPDQFHHRGDEMLDNCEVSAATGWLCGSPDLRDCSCCGCDMYGMPDRNTSILEVREVLARHLLELYDIGVTMLRIDAAIYTPVDTLSNILNRAPWDYVYQEWWGEYPVPERTSYIGHYRDVEYRFKVTRALAMREPSRLHEVLDVNRGVFGLKEESSLYPFAYHDGRSPGAYSGIATYKNGLEYHQQQRYFLAAPFGVSMLIWGGYGWSHMDQGPPGCNLGDERCKPDPVFDEDGSHRCMETPTESPLPRTQTWTRRWICEHRWAGVAGLVHFRKACRGLEVSRRWKHGEDEGVGLGNFAFRLGDSCFVALVRGYNPKKPEWARVGTWALSGLATGLPPGRYCDLASLPTQAGWDRRSCPREVTLGQGGTVLNGTVLQGDILAIHAGALLSDER